MAKNAAARNLFCHFTFFFNFSCFSTATKEKKNTNVYKIPLLCLVYLGFGWGRNLFTDILN